MIDNEQIAHDLAMVYVTNRYGAEVTGQFDVSTSAGDVIGSGHVETTRFPDVDVVRMVKVDTGETRFFGLVPKTKMVESDEYEVDASFVNMINDYRNAYSRFLELLKST